MRTMKITAYDVVIKCDWLGDRAYVQLGVIEDGHHEEAHWETYVDERIYFYLTADEIKIYPFKIGRAHV